MAAIEINNLSKAYGKRVIFNNFDLKIEKDEMVAIMGSSGCGKTTLLNIIGLIEPYNNGIVKLLSQNAPKVNSQKAVKYIRNNISYLFQSFALVENFNVEQNLMLALRYVKKTRGEKKKLIEDALKLVGLQGYQKEKVYTLSGGQQQRVALARVILKPSELILADEPTGSLDSSNRDVILKILHMLNEMGKTVVIVTHDPIVANSCDRVIELT
ncbi:ABC transporter ATP-binding protein [Faecalitalea cylindroides]|uniref:ABC transporter ATP-binding protein n=1 Tax=Faecalitalea cylindroides TaxID=39483 RepID=UPI0039F4C160